MSDDEWAMVWAAWVVAFGIAEAIAIRSKNPNAPLSHQLRRVLGIRRRSIHRRTGQVALGSGVSWLVWHLYRGVTNG